MHVDRTSCMHRGTAFFGEYHLLGDGIEAAVRVCYKGERLEAKVGRRLAEIVAHDLLRELVVQEAVALKEAVVPREVDPERDGRAQATA